MITTSNIVARRLAKLLEQHGVSRIIVSPGSRNAPLIQAVDSHGKFDISLVTDERQAGFVALGVAEIQNSPVAIICTSGSAPLDYMPAVAEAYYSRVPLIVITADRPRAWIGQDDSQTIVQPGVMDKIVKKSYHIDTPHNDEDVWFAERQINDALLTAVAGAPGPVHINIAVGEPIGELEDIADEQTRVVTMVSPEPWLSADNIKRLAYDMAHCAKVMIVCGFMTPDKSINASINRLAALPNTVVMTESVANLHGDRLISNIDGALAAVPQNMAEDFEPELVITTGGALISRHIKEYLRRLKGIRHWHVSRVDETVDCFKQLNVRINTSPKAFFSQLMSTVAKNGGAVESDFGRRWMRVRERAISLTKGFAARAQWSDFKAMDIITDAIPRRWNVQYSNGTPIRYGQIFGFRQLHRCNCNRGVSGIDGCTSTAVGASMAYLHDATILISGDTSAVYDIGVLSLSQITPRFKMVVINNGGGGIFRFIKSTSSMPIKDKYLAVQQPVEALAALAGRMGFKFLEVDNEVALQNAMSEMIVEKEHPVLIVTNTPAEQSATTLNDFFDFCKNN